MGFVGLSLSQKRALEQEAVNDVRFSRSRPKTGRSATHLVSGGRIDPYATLARGRRRTS